MNLVGQIVSTTFGFIEKFVPDGESVVATYRKGLPFFQSTGSGLKWPINNTSKDYEERFFQVLSEVIDLMIENGLRVEHD